MNEVIQAVKSTEHYSIKAKSYYDNGYIKSIEITIANP